jgi:hypothetical protein
VSSCKRDYDRFPPQLQRNLGFELFLAQTGQHPPSAKPMNTSPDVRAAAHEAGVTVIDAPVMATGRLELRWYLHEQTVSRVRHRYGNVIAPAGTE